MTTGIHGPCTPLPREPRSPPALWGTRRVRWAVAGVDALPPPLTRPRPMRILGQVRSRAAPFRVFSPARLGAGRIRQITPMIEQPVRSTADSERAAEHVYPDPDPDPDPDRAVRSAGSDRARS